MKSPCHEEVSAADTSWSPVNPIGPRRPISSTQSSWAHARRRCAVTGSRSSIRGVLRRPQKMRSRASSPWVRSKNRSHAVAGSIGAAAAVSEDPSSPASRPPAVGVSDGSPSEARQPSAALASVREPPSASSNTKRCARIFAVWHAVRPLRAQARPPRRERASARPRLTRPTAARCSSTSTLRGTPSTRAGRAPRSALLGRGHGAHRAELEGSQRSPSAQSASSSHGSPC